MRARWRYGLTGDLVGLDNSLSQVVISRMSFGDQETTAHSIELPAGLMPNIVRHINPRRVILFGSRAKGTARHGSDYDLLLIVDDDTPPERVDWRVMSEVRRGISGAVDILPFRESTFRKRVGIVGSLPWLAATEGVIVYERQRADASAPAP